MPVRAIAALVALAVFVAFMANGREIATYDSQSSKYLAVEIATRQTFTLGHTVGRVPQLGERPAFQTDLQGNYRSALPLPSALAAGAVAWLLSASRLVDLDAPLGASLVAKLTASLLTAMTVACAFLAAARRTSLGTAVIVALGLGLGTNFWVGVSQTLWQQETALLALMGAIVLLGAGRASTSRFLAAGVLLGLAGWARPQLAPAVLVLCLSMLVRFGWRSTVGLLPVAAVAALAFWVNLSWFGHPLGAAPALEALHPSIHGVAGSVTRNPWLSALGLLISPSRGLLVFSPIVLIAAAGLGAMRREGWRSDLTWCLAAAATQFVAYSYYSVWWGGHTFGPRYLLDLLPALVPLGAAGMQTILPRPGLRVAAAVCLAWSVAVAATGAFVYPADRWNTDPADVDRHHARLWQWRESQIIRAFRSEWSPQNFTLFSRSAFRRAPQPAAGGLPPTAQAR